MAGYVPSFTRRSARSRPESGSGLPVTSVSNGALNFLISAGSTVPLDSSTVRVFSGSTSAVPSARALASRQDLVLEVRPLAAHQALRLQRRLHARLIDRLLLELVQHPRRHAVDRIDDVRIGDEPAAAVDEPAGARLDERRRFDRHRALAAVHRDLGVDPGRDERDGGLGEQDRFLGRQRERGCGPQQHGDHANDHTDPRVHRPDRITEGRGFASRQPKRRRRGYNDRP